MSEEAKTPEEVKMPDPGTPGGLPRIIDIETADDEEIRKKLRFVKSFSFSHFSEDDGVLYEGTFTAKRVNLGDIGQIAVMKSRLNAELVIHRNLDLMHEMLAYLTYALVKAPDWWNPAEFYDAQLLSSVYNYVRSWEDSFRLTVDKRRGAAAKDSSEKSAA